MDADLYDEFGNYIGPDLESEDEDDDEQENFAQSESQPDYDVNILFEQKSVKVTTVFLGRADGRADRTGSDGCSFAWR